MHERSRNQLKWFFWGKIAIFNVFYDESSLKSEKIEKQILYCTILFQFVAFARLP